MSGRITDGVASLRHDEMMEFKALVMSLLYTNGKKNHLEFLLMLSMGLCWGGHIFY